MTRRKVYELIDGERDYQDQLARVRGWKAIDCVPAKSAGDYITLLTTYIRRAQDAWTDNCGEEAALDVVRKIAGIAVRCMEENGGPPRQSPPPDAL